VILAEKGDIGGQLLDKSEAGSPNFKQSVAVSDREGTFETDQSFLFD
jgi:hypothetical protein